jgi:predicted NBD/HSP70 family sugar kinase
MSQPTAGKIVDELLLEKILEEVEVEVKEPAANGSVRLGRPGRQLQMTRSQPGFLGIQLGIQETQVAELPLGAAVESDWRHAFPVPPKGPNPAVVWERGLRAVAKKLRSKKFRGVLLSVPGVVDESSKRILFSPNIHWSENADLPAVIRRVWKAPVIIVQEEQVVALGYHFNHPAHEDFLLVDFGEGVGGAVIVGGKPLASPLPISGELGHTPVLGNRRRCGCGASGCVETLVSTRGLLESFAAAHPETPGDWPALTRQIAADGVEPGLAQSLAAAAVAIAAALNVLGLRRVIITGSLTELPPAVVQHLSQAIQSGAMWARFGQVECLGAPRCRASGLVAIGIDRLVVPEMTDQPGKKSAAKISPRKKAGARNFPLTKNQK